METIYEFTKTQELVETLLKEEVRCRNDDKWLCYRVIRHFTKAYIPFEDFSKFPSFETISRVRRKVQNDEDKYLPTDPEVLLKRRLRSQDVALWSQLDRKPNHTLL